MTLRQKDLITSHFKNPNSGDGNAVHEFVTQRPVKKASKRDILDLIVLGEEDSNSPVENRYEAKDVVTAFLFGAGFVFFFIITLIYASNH